MTTRETRRLFWILNLLEDLMQSFHFEIDKFFYNLSSLKITNDILIFFYSHDSNYMKITYKCAKV